MRAPPISCAEHEHIVELMDALGRLFLLIQTFRDVAIFTEDFAAIELVNFCSPGGPLRWLPLFAVPHFKANWALHDGQYDVTE